MGGLLVRSGSATALGMVGTGTGTGVGVFVSRHMEGIWKFDAFFLELNY